MKSSPAVAVTGASSGIGRAVAAAAAAREARVIGFGRRFAKSALAAMPAPGAIAEVALDVTREEDVAARFGELAGLDALILSHGDATFAAMANAEVADVRAMLEAHVVGSFLCARAACPMMAAGGGGHIIAITSVAAVRAFPDCSGYTAAKAGQRGLLRVIAEEVRAQGIRVTNVVLGAVDTPIWDGRDGFDRTRMMAAGDVAGLIADLLWRPGLGIEEITIVHPGGNL